MSRNGLGYKRIILNRISGHLWLIRNPFDFEGSEPANYYRAYLENPSGEPFARIVAIRDDALDLRLWDPAEKKFEEELQLGIDIAVADRKIRLFRKYHDVQIRYESEREFLAKDWWYPLLIHVREKFLQGTYQLTRPIRIDRLRVLAAVLDKRLNDNEFEYILENDSTSTEELATRLFGQRVERRQDYGMIDSKLSLILDSLVESGDVARAGDRRFKPLGKAISTMSQAAAEDRRHRDITRLTAMLVVTGLLAVDWERFLGWVSRAFDALTALID